MIKYDQFDQDGDNVHSGVYEEYWVGTKKYKRIYKSDNLNQLDYATDRGLSMASIVEVAAFHGNDRDCNRKRRTCGECARSIRPCRTLQSVRRVSKKMGLRSLSCAGQTRRSGNEDYVQQ